jgi:predicted Rossmann fold nucleotide-binding protein DprA/Smf involved in DNA uptake
MRAYRVSTIFTQQGLLEFLDHNLNINVTVQAMPEEQGATVERDARPAPDPIYTPERVRAKRKSKVTSAILDSLEKGKGEVADLKAALEEAGMSAASLSTGLAILQKNGTVKRSQAGFYFIPEKEAAE